jgi:hypothetical protein
MLYIVKFQPVTTPARDFAELLLAGKAYDDACIAKSAQTRYDKT